MDSKQYFASITVNKVESSELRKILDVLFTADVDLADINLHISEALGDEEEESIHDTTDELIDESSTPVRIN